MQLKKIALILAFPLVVGVGWVLRAALEPAPEPSSGGAAPADEQPVASAGAKVREERPADAERPQDPDAKKPARKGGAEEGAGDKKPKRGPGALPTNIPTIPMTLVLTDGPGGPAVTDVQVFLSPAEESQRSGLLVEWTQSEHADELQRAAFGEDGLAVNDEGTVTVDVPLETSLRADVRGPGVGDENRVVVIRALKKSMTRPREIDVQKTQKVPAGETGRPTAEARPSRDSQRGAPVSAVEDAPTEFFHVKVVDAADASAVLGASVRYGQEELARSDEDGRFSLAFDPSLSPVLQVVMPGYAPAIVQAKLGYHYPERALVVELRPGASIEARLLTPDGEAARGTQVVLSTDMASVLGVDQPEEGTAARLGELTWSATANQLGMVFFESLPTDARLEIGLLRPGQRGEEPQRGLGAIPTSVTLSPGEAWKPEWRLPGRPEIAGRLVDHNGIAIPDAQVWLVGLADGEPAIARYLRPEEVPAEIATTDSQGRFRFVDLDPVAWLVGLSPAAPQSAAEWQTALGSLAVPALVGDVNAPPPDELLIVASRGLTIRGVVLGPGGFPAAGALVTALEENGHGALEVRAQQNGGFVLGPLSAGRFALLVSGCADCGVERFGPFQAGSREVVLSLRAVRRYSGHVVSAAGDPRAARLTVFEDGALRAQIDTRSGLQPGRFEVALEPGLYDFIATTIDGEVGSLRSVSIGADTPTSGFTLPVERGALVSALYRGKHPWRHVSYYRDGRLFATGVLQAGVRRGQFVPAGRILVRMQTELGEPRMEREFEISAGSEMEVEFGGVQVDPPALPAPVEESAAPTDG